MKVTFVLPGGAPVPTGGARMVLRYANALVEAGWEVTVLFPSRRPEARGSGGLARDLRYALWRCTGTWSPRRWMAVDPRVQLRWVRDLTPASAPTADVVVATAMETAEAVAAWPDRAGAKCYFIQGYETWDHPRARVEASWRLPLRKIAVSRWLCELVAAKGERAEHLPNGVDAAAFGLDVPPEQREPLRLIWPYHVAPGKGTADVLQALVALAGAGVAVKATAFGTSPAPRWPVPVEYHRNPPAARLRALYNAAAIAVAPSHAEGWGLPACEALQCGCALAASDIGGHREFLRDDENALLHAPGDAEALRQNLTRLLGDAALRARLARTGVADMAARPFAPQVARFRSWLEEAVRR